MDFFAKLFGKDSHITPAYQSYGQYLTDEPIQVFYQGQVVAQVEKLLQTRDVDGVVTHRISYDPLEMLEVLRGLNLPENTPLVFNGSDIVVGGRAKAPVEVLTHATVVFDGFEGDPFVTRATTTTTIHDSYMSTIEQTIDLHQVARDVIAQAISENPLLTGAQIVEARFDADNDIIVLCQPASTFDMTIAVNARVRGSVTATSHYAVGELGMVKTPLEPLEELVAASGLIHPYEHINEIVSSHSIIYVDTAINPDAFDAPDHVVDHLTQFADGYIGGPDARDFVEDYLTHTFALKGESHGETD